MTDGWYETLEDDLVHAVWRQDLAEVQRLLQAGAHPNRPGRAWSSAIACAGENDRTGDMVRCLVLAGADINIQDEQGQTPLHWAVDVAVDGAIQTGRDKIDWRVVGVLLDLGANLKIPDQCGRTAEDLVANYGAAARQSFDGFLKARHDAVR